MPRSSRTRNVAAAESQSEMAMGSRRVMAGLLRGLGQALEQWADRLEAAITQVTATLPDPRVRKDLLAKLWRLWLTIVAQMVRRLPPGWGSFFASVLPIAAIGLLLCLGVWIPSMVFTTPTITPEITPKITPETETIASNPDWEDVVEPPEGIFVPSESPAPSFPPAESSGEPPTVINPVILPEAEPVSREPLGPPIPNWSTLSSPLAEKVQAKLVEKLSPSGQGLVQRLQVNFSQRELTVYVSEEWQMLTPIAKQRFVESLQTQARQLDFPHLRLMDEQGKLLARTAIVGQGIIFNQPI